MKKLIITLCSIGLAFGSIQAQQEGRMGPPDGNVPSVPDFTPPNGGNEIPEEILALHGEVKMLRETLRESRQATLGSLSEDATREEKMEAMSAWREENADQLAKVQSLSEDLRGLINENRPDGPWIDVPDEILALREDLTDKRTDLADSRREAIAALGEDPTDEEVRAAIDAWREANTDAIAEVQALADQLRDWFRENRPERPGAAFTPGMALRRAAFKNNMQEMKQNRETLRNQLQNPDLTNEERQQIMATFREEQREMAQERKELKRQQRISQGGVGGDRRPGG